MHIIIDVILILFLSAAVLLDFRFDKIPNLLIITGIFTGFFINCYCRGFHGLADALSGCLLPFLLLFLLHIFAMIGAGDIKLFMIAGAFLGLRGSVFSIIAAFFTGAVLSLTLMIKHRNFFSRLHYFMQYFNHLIKTRGPAPYYNLNQPQAGETIHFSLCIALGSLLYMALTG